MDGCAVLVKEVGQSASIAVVGSDGFVGNGLAGALNAKRIVYGPAQNGEWQIREAKDLIGQSDVVINCGGFRVRPGCDVIDYRRSHEGSTSAFIPWLRKGSLFVHISSASVLGKGEGLGNRSPANPTTFPSPTYASAKYEQDCYLQKASMEQGFRCVFLRPAVVYSRQGAGMVETMLKLAKRGIILRAYPREARHHLVHINLVAEVVRRIIERGDDIPNLSTWVVADPYVVSNEQLEAMIREALDKRYVPLPLPVHWVSALLKRTWHSKNPKFDLKTWGEIFGVLAMDTVYDPSETLEQLGIDPTRYTVEKTLRPIIRESLQS
jgi:nucleoside-diphosphate-sugar epimerase